MSTYYVTGMMSSTGDSLVDIWDKVPILDFNVFGVGNGLRGNTGECRGVMHGISVVPVTADGSLAQDDGSGCREAEIDSRVISRTWWLTESPSSESKSRLTHLQGYRSLNFLSCRLQVIIPTPSLTNCGKFLKRSEYQTSWPASQEICRQVKKQ